MNSRSFRNFIFFRLIIIPLTICMAILPTIPTTSFAAETQGNSGTVTLHSDQKKKSVEEKTEEETDKAESEDTEDEGMSTTTKIVIGAGTAVIIGAALALGGGGGSSSPDPILPPTVEQLVGSWSASASSVEHLSYTGTYTLYADATHSYDLHFNNGSRKVGRGRWDINGYRLSLHNDTGTTYSGEFAAGNIVTVRLYTTVGWTLDLIKVL